jgi:uncharacterized protein Usg
MQVNMFWSYDYINIFPVMNKYILFHNEDKEVEENLKYCHPKVLPDAD